jgi:Tol biopolymer transport system component
MTNLNASRAPRVRPTVVALAIVAMATIPASANATFEGKSGPIAFQRIANLDDPDSSDIVRVNPRTGRVRTLTDSPGLSWFPDYSPNGNRIAFTRTDFDATPSDALYTMKADGSRQTPLTTQCSGECLGDSSSAWAANGRRLVFERAYGPVVDDAAAKVELRTVKADGSRERLIPLDLPGREPHDAQWSPNGRRLAVNVLNVGDTQPESASAIYVFRPDGTRLRRITPLSLNAGNPDWSPSGKRIVFNSSYEGQGAADIYTVRPDGSHLRQVHAPPADHFAFEPVFSPSGKRIAFTQTDDKFLAHIHTMRRNGTRVRQVTSGPVVDLRPDWGARR